jgi:hypothetical protein
MKKNSLKLVKMRKLVAGLVADDVRADVKKIDLEFYEVGHIIYCKKQNAFYRVEKK